MKYINNKIIAFTLIAASIMSCTDEYNCQLQVEKPQNAAINEYLAQFDLLKSYIDRSGTPFQLAVNVPGSEFVKKEIAFSTVFTNFDAVDMNGSYDPLNTLKEDGTYNFGGMQTAADVAAEAGVTIFGVGVEIAGITVSKIIVKWFKGKEMALAMGLEMATARIGTTLAMVLTVPLADFFGSTDESGTFHTNIPAPILFCLIMLCVGTIAFFLYTFYDKKLDASLDAQGLEPEEPFRMKDIVYIVTNKGFWLIALLCVLFYSAVFPFIKYAADLMVQKYNVDPKLAGTIPGLLPIGAIILTPLFGSLYDRIGKGATLMTIGAVMLIFVHTMFALPILNVWWFATIIMIVLGFAFSLVPSAMWPSVPKIIPEKQLGTAYALIFWVQNWGLMGVPLLIGWVLNSYCKGPVVDGAQTYDYTLPMAIFAIFGVLALIVSLMLKAENRKKGYGLEEANIKKESV